MSPDFNKCFNCDHVGCGTFIRCKRCDATYCVDCLDANNVLYDEEDECLLNDNDCDRCDPDSDTQETVFVVEQKIEYFGGDYDDKFTDTVTQGVYTTKQKAKDSIISHTKYTIEELIDEKLQHEYTEKELNKQLGKFKKYFDLKLNEDEVVVKAKLKTINDIEIVDKILQHVCGMTQHIIIFFTTEYDVNKTPRSSFYNSDTNSDSD